jgi:osmotically-inducible protein OsmY
MQLSNPARENRPSATLLEYSEIHREAEERFRESSYLAVRTISCTVGDGVIHLHGSLPSYYLKQVAQELASSVEGVRQVINRIEVFAPADQGRPRPENLSRLFAGV